MSNRTKILDHQKIEQKVNRIAYQIYEDNHEVDQLIIAGIANNGFVFAQLLAEKLTEISEIKIILKELIIDKKNPVESKVKLDLTSDEIKDQVIILVDDVLNSGKTMMYGLKHFLNAPIKKLSTAVLVNRSHNRFPVSANYVGMSLATTLKEHIEVSFTEDDYSACLI